MTPEDPTIPAGDAQPEEVADEYKKKPVAGKAIAKKGGKKISVVGRKKKKKSRFGTKAKIAAGIVALLTVIIFYGMQPIVGSIRFGICRTYVELDVRYPTTLQINLVEESHMTVRMYYSHIDAFGSSNLNMAECEFKTDPRRGLVLHSVRINREDVDREKLADFNYSIPYIMQNPPDLRLPHFRTDALIDLKIDYY